MTTPDVDFDIDDDSWKTPEIRAAEAELDASVDRAHEAIAKAEELQLQPVELGVTKEQLEQVEAAAKAKDAPAELRALQQKVDKGELSWSNVLAGKAYNDPDVRKAMEGSMARMAAMYQSFEEGYGLDEVIEAQVARDAGESGFTSASASSAADNARFVVDDDDPPPPPPPAQAGPQFGGPPAGGPPFGGPGAPLGGPPRPSGPPTPPPPARPTRPRPADEDDDFGGGSILS